MAFPLVPNVVQLHAHMLIDSESYDMVMYAQIADPPTTDGIADAAQDFLDGLGENLLPVWTDNVQLISVTATYLGNETRPSFVATPDTPAFGTVSGSPLPNNCALVLSKATAGLTVVKRGRVFHTGMPITWMLTPNRMQIENVENIVDAYNDLLEGFNASFDHEHALVVLSGYKDDAPDEDVVVAPIDRFYARDNILDSQRRRLPTRGI